MCRPSIFPHAVRSTATRRCGAASCWKRRRAAFILPVIPAGPHIAAIHECFGPMTLSLLPIGTYLPQWFMAPVHMSPDEAVAAAEMLQARVTLPIHFDTFRLADDAFGEAVTVR